MLLRVSIALVLIVLILLGVAGWDQLHVTEEIVEDGNDQLGGPYWLQVVRRHHALRGDRFELRAATHGTDPTWSAALPRHGVLRTLSSATASIEGAVVLLDRERGRARHGVPDLFDAEDEEPTPPEPPRFVSWRDRYRGDGVLRTSSGAGLCLVAHDGGVAFCVDTPGPASNGRYDVIRVPPTTGPLIELLATSPPVVLAHDPSDGHVLWRAEIAADANGEDIAALLPLEDNGLAVAVGDAFFSLDPITGAVHRETAEGAITCFDGLSLFVLDGGHLSASLAHGVALHEIAQPGPGRLDYCARVNGLDLSWVGVASATPGHGAPDQAIPLTVPFALTEGVGVFVADTHGAVVRAVAMPWGLTIAEYLHSPVVWADGEIRVDLAVTADLVAVVLPQAVAPLPVE